MGVPTAPVALGGRWFPHSTLPCPAIPKVTLDSFPEVSSDSSDPIYPAQTRLAAVVEAQQAIATAGLDTELVMREVVQQVQELTGASGVVVELVEEDEMVYRGVGGSATPHLGLRLKVDGSISGLCVRSGAILRCDDSEHDPRVDREACRRVGARSLVVAPLPARGLILGVLKVYSPEAHAFTHGDVQCLQLLAALLAASIDDAQRFEATEALLATERALRESEESFRAIFEGAPIGVALVGLDGRLVQVNGRLEEQLGYTAEELRAMNFAAFTHPDDLAADLSLFEELAAGRRTNYQIEKRYYTKDGAILWGNLSVALLRDAEGRPLYAVGMVEDITERKRSERLLAEHRVELERSNRELQDFAYVASHDLQEPLRKIQAFGDRLKSRHSLGLGEQGQDYLNRMQGAAARMQALIRDLLSYSRVTSNAQPFASVSLSQVAADVTEDLQTQIERTAGTVEIGELPTIEADPVQMRQLIQNLVSNALKFHREGVPPEVRISAEVQGNTVQLRVADNGIGFEEKYIERIFSPFERLHGRGEYEGTGMGLAICRKIARRHGGDLWAQSAPGEGATFVATFPLEHVNNGGDV